MPKDNIERAIKKGQGNDPDTNYEEVRYEGYGPDGVAIIVEALTNNKNRTASEIRSTFSKYGGNLGETGSVSFGFERIGNISLSRNFVKEEDLFDFLLENETDDYDVNDDEYIIYCDQNKLHQLNDKIIKTYGQTNYSNLIWKSKNSVNIDKQTADKLFKLLEILEDNDDVQGVSSNFEVDETVMSSLTS
jgi:YebC/PmpR family DNA-binding regulatory protein